ncbi:DUF393 domain-containing protein [Pseudomonas vlassakiae]|uniref:thiol-disulfide oxidoreductase DCC family protein n=1 Tax=Pseudomonas TaxID=286 RepID=UPI0009E9EFC9|nr:MULTISPECIES: DUF393 domain-containing protein [Pseudomonas]MBS3185939.1 DUF393 domain-containing protein [Pseudomonas sp. PCH44]MCU0125879.1 DUF393 domain-containing protein [Pseudomonas vlassakiae]PIK75069.1 DUF393 domain-containing protein [Pseudomonas sp. 382]
MYCQWPLTLYFDGACPLCSREVAFLRRRSTAAKLILIDIDGDGFDPRPLGLTIEQLRSCLHARFANDQWVTGLDATLWSWRAAGVGIWAAPLAWRPLRPFLSVFYRLFCLLRPGLAWLPHPEGGQRCKGEESKCRVR